MRNGKRILGIGIGLIVLFGLSRLIAEPYHISGDCMEPAYKDGELHFLNHVARHLRPYKIGDVVLYQHDGRVWISRIVALGGDSIQIREKKVIVNGKDLQDEGNVLRNWPGWKYGSFALDETLKVPAGHVYMLSDKLSAQHDDSRVFGTIAEDMIQGLVWP